MAAAELEDGSKIIYRNIDFNSYGVLNVREDFAQKYPDYVKKVIADYERARLWILQNPDQAAQILSDAAQIKIDVAKRELVDRTVLDKDVGTPGDAQNTALKAVVPIFTSEKLVTSKTDPAVALSQLFDPSFAKAVIPAK